MSGDQPGVLRSYAALDPEGHQWEFATVSPSPRGHRRKRSERVKRNHSIPPSTVIPVLVYPDVREAVAWLSEAFGFVERTRVGESHRAQLSIGTDGAMIVADRHYSNNHALLAELRERGVDFVLRLNNNVILEPVGPERPLTEEDRREGVVWDRTVRLGVHGDGPVFRVVRVEANGDVFHLITTREDLSAALISLIYRQRWQIELFFKWIKTILNCRHWLAESPEGVRMQIYCVLIASLLLMLWTGQRPNKRMVESLQWYWTGMADAEDLVTLLQRAGCKKKS